jgi:hypothetical protein
MPTARPDPSSALGESVAANTSHDGIYQSKGASLNALTLAAGDPRSSSGDAAHGVSQGGGHVRRLASALRDRGIIRNGRAVGENRTRILRLRAILTEEWRKPVTANVTWRTPVPTRPKEASDRKKQLRLRTVGAKSAADRVIYSSADVRRCSTCALAYDLIGMTMPQPVIGAPQAMHAGRAAAFCSTRTVVAASWKVSPAN